jgi:ferredoxin
MPKKYHINVKNADPRFAPVGKYATVEFREDCAGSCRLCVKKNCVYGVYKDNFVHASTMTEPEYQYICKSCYRCVQECTKGIFTLALNPEYRTLGDDYWTADIINSTWAQSHTGKIPVSGAGYRGRFVGEGFDSMWTDMSEIVRPTRDGIHGREYINTVVELSRRPVQLKFSPDRSLAMDLPPILEIPLPVMFQQPEFGMLSQTVLVSMARAAASLGTMMFVRAQDVSSALAEFESSIVPCLTMDGLRAYSPTDHSSRMIELAFEPGIEAVIAALRGERPDLAICVGLPLDAVAAETSVALARIGADTIHLYGTASGREVGTDSPRYLKEMIREVHLALVNQRLRDKVNLVFSGGIAMAEHMAKSLICGADAISIDIPLLLALECRLCYKCREGKPCPVKLEDVELVWATQRIVNLMGAWHNQLLEVMGACGIREARRLRGEVGRSLWFEDLEKENFGPIFGTRKVAGIG